MRKWYISKKSYLTIKRWTEHKSIENFKLLYNDTFTSGFFIWKVWRILRNTLKGTYEKMIVDYEKNT